MQRKTQWLIAIFGVLLLVFTTIFYNANQKANQSESNFYQSSQIISGSFDKSKFKTDAEWKKILRADEYHILREQGTEIPFTGGLDHETRKGTYYSVGCNEGVFRSEAKYDSGTGWPSFWEPISKDALVLRKDNSLPGEKRIEVLDICGNHLGHVFADGPTTLPDGRQASGKRYCMNSIALKFVPDK